MSNISHSDQIEDDYTSKCDEIRSNTTRINLIPKQLLVIFLQLVQSRQKRFITQRKNHRTFISSPYTLKEETCEVFN